MRIVVYNVKHDEIKNWDLPQPTLRSLICRFSSFIIAKRQKIYLNRLKSSKVFFPTGSAKQVGTFVPSKGCQTFF